MPPNSSEVLSGTPEIMETLHNRKEREDKPMSRANYRVPDHLWLIHDKLYNFDAYVNRHPGGLDWILLGRGRDCTELFESTHALVKTHPSRFMAKYEVKDHGETIPPEIFDWSDDGFYPTLTRRVREHFKKKGYSHHADILYYVKMSLIWTFGFFVLRNLYTSTHPIFWSFVYGMTMEIVGFTCMHDASHFGLSSIPAVNKWISIFWNSWGLWSHWLWLQHHCYAHHSFTGIPFKDPDTVHAMAVIRKIPESRFTPGMMKYQHLYFWFWMWFLPGQHLGQGILYQMAPARKRLFGMRLVEWPAQIKWQVTFEQVVRWTSIIIHFILPFYVMDTVTTAILVVFAQWGAQGFSYWCCVAPNHDSLKTHRAERSALAERIDWGENQVRTSGDHSTGDSLVDTVVTQLWGGMNFQIEHHLFPALCHIHHKDVHQIVKKTCREYGIPIPLYSSWFGALCDVQAWLKMMSKKGTPVLEPLLPEPKIKGE
jgi:fatty acid desaturase